MMFFSIRSDRSYTFGKIFQEKKKEILLFNDPINSFPFVLLLSSSQMNIIICECCKEYQILILDHKSSVINYKYSS